MATSKKTIAKKPSRKHVMDVSKPGKSTPSASSKPVIVGHKPTVQDPMVTKERDMPEESEEHKIEVKRTAPKVIAPLADTKETETDTEEAAGEEAAAEESAEPSAEADAPNQSVENVDEGEPEPDEQSQPAESDEVADTKAKDTGSSSRSEKPSKTKDAKDNKKGEKDDKTDKEAEEVKKRLAEVEKLVDEKKYFVHTSQGTKKQRRRTRTGLLIILVLLVGTYLALDAQLIKNNLQLPFEFFKEQQHPEPTTDAAQTNTPPSLNSSQTSKANRLYVDTAKYFSFNYPDTWTVKPQEWGVGTDGPTKPEPDWNKVSRAVSIIPKSGEKGNNVEVATDCKTTTSDGEETTVLQSIKDGKDKFHTQRAVQINGHDGFYDRLDFVGDAERYVRHTYYVANDTACLTLVFTESHHHPMSGTDFNDKANVPLFEAIVQSVAFLK